jgi:copper chaperone CopZ
MTSKTFHIPDIGCDGCVRAIRNELEEMAGVQVLAAEVEGRKVTVAWEAPATEQAIVQALAAIDYAPAPV